MATLSKISTRALRENLAQTMGRVTYANERIGITKNGKLAAVLISPDDAALLEELEMQADIAAYRAAKAEDDGQRFTLAQVLDELETFED